MNNLTLIIPAKNEKESLPVVLNEIKKLDCKITVTLQENDIATVNVINNINVELFYQTGVGYGNSLREAIKNCKTEYFCIFNADGSFDYKDLFKMYDLIKDNDFVFTSRYMPSGGSDDDTIITYFGNKFFSSLGKIFFSQNLMIKK